MKIKTQFRINILIAIALVLVAGGILFYADRRIDAEMEKNWMADRITRSVFDLHNLSNSYLLYREDRQRMQWNLNLASLKKLIKEAKRDSKRVDENLEIISQRCDEMEALFERIISYAGRLDNTPAHEAALIREAYSRLITNLTAKGQEMVNRAFLLIQESNKDLSSTKRGAILLVMTSILLAIGISIFISIFLSNRILADLQLLQKGTEIVAGGNLDYRVDIGREDEIGQLTIAFNEMTRRLSEFEKELEINNKKLAQSNKDLEDFAFVASHDLQEPLRKIETFGSRLRDKCGRQSRGRRPRLSVKNAKRRDEDEGVDPGPSHLFKGDDQGRSLSPGFLWRLLLGKLFRAWLPASNRRAPVWMWGTCLPSNSVRTRWSSSSRTF